MWRDKFRVLYTVIFDWDLPNILNDTMDCIIVWSSLYGAWVLRLKTVSLSHLTFLLVPIHMSCR